MSYTLIILCVLLTKKKKIMVLKSRLSQYNYDMTRKVVEKVSKFKLFS